jgi:biopolymer transport protein ExbB
LSIAVVALIALNYFSARVAKLTFELQTAATNAEVLLKTALISRDEPSRDKWLGATPAQPAA